MSTSPLPLHDPALNPAAPVLQRIPLSLRMTVYTLFFLALVLVLLPALFAQLDAFVPALHVELPRGLRSAGVSWMGLSLLTYLASSIVLTAKGKGPFVEFDPPKELVVEGPYRFVRNPIVLALISTQFGEALALSSTGVLLMAIIFAILGNVQVVKFEEPLLAQRYGDAYRDYCAHVSRWLPRFKAYSPSQVAEADARA